MEKYINTNVGDILFEIFKILKMCLLIKNTTKYLQR